MALVSLDKVKSATYLNISGASNDVELQELIDDVSQRAVQYMDRETAYDEDTCPADVSDAICKQVSHDWRHRESPGQTVHVYEDGSADKFGSEEFIPLTKRVLNLHREFLI